MDGTQAILLAKYNPAKLQELLQAHTAATKSEAPPVQVAAPKSAPEAIQEVLGMVVIMNSSVYSESAIFAAMTSFNREHLEYMAYSFTLPTATNGIPAGSWVLTNIEDLDGKN